MKRLFNVPLLVFIAFSVIAGCNKDGSVEMDVNPPPEMELKDKQSAQNKILAEIRRATAKYHDIDAADADGYELDPHCVEHPFCG